MSNRINRSKLRPIFLSVGLAVVSIGAANAQHKSTIKKSIEVAIADLVFRTSQQ